MEQPSENVAPIAPEDLRAAIARSRVPAYLVAARVRINPIKLSRLLHGHAGLSQAEAARILRAIQEEAANVVGR